jgi:hypothetical protein
MSVRLGGDLVVKSRTLGGIYGHMAHGRWRRVYLGIHGDGALVWALATAYAVSQSPIRLPSVSVK